MIKLTRTQDQPPGPRFAMLWLFSLIAFLVAGWFLLGSIVNGSAIGMVVSGIWLLNIIVGPLSIHTLLCHITKEENQHENVND